MTITPVALGNFPQQPASLEFLYSPDQLIAGDFKRVTYNGTISQGYTIARGTIMGQQTVGTATAAATGGNTGNGTISAVTETPTAQLGAYTVKFTSATAFNVIDPRGRQLKPGTTGTAYSDDLGFTITAGGTAFAANDSFTITVAAGTGNYIPSVATATDGSQNPSGILVDYVDSTLGAVVAGIFQTGEFNQNAITFDTSWTISALQPILQKQSIFLKNAVSALPPS